MLTLLVVLAYLSDVYGLFAVHNLVYTDCSKYMYISVGLITKHTEEVQIAIYSWTEQKK